MSSRTINPALEEQLIASLTASPLPGVVSVYLFGSRAAGRAHAESDVDVAVLLRRTEFPTERDRFEARLFLTAEMIARLRVNAVDLVVLNDVPPLFARRVVTEGHRVFGADAEADLAFIRDTLLRAADLAPWVKRMAALKLEALRR
jgi:predicted nucleotidyltransferase